MSVKQPSIEAELEWVSGAVLMPVRWVVLLGILASLHLRFGLSINRIGILVAVAVYAAVAVGLPHMRGQPFKSYAVGRLLLAADLLFSAAVFFLSDGIRSPYFGLWYLALIHSALVMERRTSMSIAVAAAALVTASELMLPGGRQALMDANLALGKLPFLLLITWTSWRLAQEVRNREARRRQAEQRALTSEAGEERTRREMEIARRVQECLLPVVMPTFPGLTLAALSCPARAVGCDTYDLIELPDGRLLAAIADVCGKGVPAALLAVAVQQGIRQFAGPEPAAVLAGVNRLLRENSPADMFVTAACIVIDPRDGNFAAAAAGHPPPLWWDHRVGRLIPITDPGPALTLQPEWAGPTERRRLAPGDALMLYTDGVLDAKMGRLERLGEVRLAELLARTAPQNAEEWIARLRRGLEGCLEWPDDVTAVAIGAELSLSSAPGTRSEETGSCTRSR